MCAPECWVILSASCRIICRWHCVFSNFSRIPKVFTCRLLRAMSWTQLVLCEQYRITRFITFVSWNYSQEVNHVHAYVCILFRLRVGIRPKVCWIWCPITARQLCGGQCCVCECLVYVCLRFLHGPGKIAVLLIGDIELDPSNPNRDLDSRFLSPFAVLARSIPTSRNHFVSVSLFLCILSSQ